MLFTAKLLTILKSVSFNLWCVFPISVARASLLSHMHARTRFSFLLAHSLSCCTWLNVNAFSQNHVVHIAFNSIVEITTHKPLLEHFELFIFLHCLWFLFKENLSKFVLVAKYVCVCMWMCSLLFSLFSGFLDYFELFSALHIHREILNHQKKKMKRTTFTHGHLTEHAKE